MLKISTSDFQTAMHLTEEIAKPFESCSLSAYWDPVGFPTNGWGHLLSRTTKKETMKKLGFSSAEADEWLRITWPDISQDQANKEFLLDLGKAYRTIERLVKVALSPEQVAALTDFSFNCGGGNLQISTLLRMVNRGEFIDAADQFVRWNKAGGIVLRGLTRRRLSERFVFLKGTK